MSASLTNDRCHDDRVHTQQRSMRPEKSRRERTRSGSTTLHIN